MFYEEEGWSWILIDGKIESYQDWFMIDSLIER